ncbi:hypothetical protein PR048_002565 [Dryococelus australis]|uniref:Uncharacterized protein n=1 Tax=Dryococelus australis TaxID=614101 RepID=A0ABQ9ILZ7_9NEOP|nr:hypothetical protein PR048_002565 [Dryococelus australis]
MGRTSMNKPPVEKPSTGSIVMKRTRFLVHVRVWKLLEQEWHKGHFVRCFLFGVQSTTELWSSIGVDSSEFDDGMRSVCERREWEQQSFNPSYKAFHCDECDAVFTRSDILYRPSKTCKGNVCRSSGNECKYCSKSFAKFCEAPTANEEVTISWKVRLPGCRLARSLPGATQVPRTAGPKARPRGVSRLPHEAIQRVRAGQGLPAVCARLVGALQAADVQAPCDLPCCRDSSSGAIPTSLAWSDITALELSSTADSDEVTSTLSPSSFHLQNPKGEHLCRFLHPPLTYQTHSIVNLRIVKTYTAPELIRTVDSKEATFNTLSLVSFLLQQPADQSQYTSRVGEKSTSNTNNESQNTSGAERWWWWRRYRQSQLLRGEEVEPITTHLRGVKRVREESSAGMQKWGEREIPEKTRRPRVSFGTILTCKNPVVISPGNRTRLALMGDGQCDHYTTTDPGHTACLPPWRTRRVAPGFSHVGTVPDDSTCRRVFSGISRFPVTYIPALLHSPLTSHSSALKTLMLRAVKVSIFLPDGSVFLGGGSYNLSLAPDNCYDLVVRQLGSEYIPQSYGNTQGKRYYFYPVPTLGCSSVPEPRSDLHTRVRMRNKGQAHSESLPEGQHLRGYTLACLVAIAICIYSMYSSPPVFSTAEDAPPR